MQFFRAMTTQLALRRLMAVAPLFFVTFSACTKSAPRGERPFAPGSAFGLPGEKAQLTSRNQAPFEAGNIGSIVRTSPDAFAVSLRSDNDDALPAFWRNWYYFKLTDVPVGVPVTLTIKGAGIGNRYVPAFSYEPRPDLRDQDAAWHLFRDAEVDEPTPLTVRVTAVFTAPTVWVARWHPYSYSRLVGFLGKVRGLPGVTLGSIGATPEGRDVPFLSVTDPRVATGKKRRVFVHARTHPGEVGSSFLVEGLMAFATGTGPEARRFRAKAVLDLVPMLNVDGVIAGNNRVSPRGINLEGKWYPESTAAAVGRKGANGLACAPVDPERAPPEVILLNTFYRERPRDGAGVAVALNLHASAGEPDDNVFFFPHFGPRAAGFEAAEARLHNKQMSFIDAWRRLQGQAWFNPPVAAGRGFENRNLPESWWWQNAGDEVMAMTIESTYGHAARSNRWVVPNDMRTMGFSLGRAMLRYLESPASRQRGRSFDLTDN